MIEADEFATNTLLREIESGVACAILSPFADAAAHLALAREQSRALHTPLIDMLDAFMECHARYWHAQQLLHETSRQFALAHTEQQRRLADLQALVAATQGDIKSVAVHQRVGE